MEDENAIKEEKDPSDATLAVPGAQKTSAEEALNERQMELAKRSKKAVDERKKYLWDFSRNE